MGFRALGFIECRVLGCGAEVFRFRVLGLWGLGVPRGLSCSVLGYLEEFVVVVVVVVVGG